jgi:uncharacterized membrane protein
MQRNISDWERAGSIIAATLIGALAASRRDRRHAAMLASAGLMVRGISGWCPISAAVGRNSRTTDTKEALGGPRGVHVRDTVTIARPVEEVYSFWRELSNLPRFMSHVESVEVLDRTRSRWTVKGPAGSSVSWEAHVINEIPNELIAWSSVGDADVVSAGSVHFKPTPSGGTRVIVHLQYSPPAGKLGAWVATLFGEDPAQQISEDLQRLKACLETRAPAIRDRSTGVPPAYPSPAGNVRPYPMSDDFEMI